MQFISKKFFRRENRAATFCSVANLSLCRSEPFGWHAFCVPSPIRSLAQVGEKKYREGLAMNEITGQKLADDVKVVINDAEELLRATASETGERIVDLRRRLEQKLVECKTELAEQERVWLQKAEQVRASATSYLRENAWTKVAIAVGVGMVLGLLLRRD